MPLRAGVGHMRSVSFWESLQVTHVIEVVYQVMFPIAMD